MGVRLSGLGALGFRGLGRFGVLVLGVPLHRPQTGRHATKNKSRKNLIKGGNHICCIASKCLVTHPLDIGLIGPNFNQMVLVSLF